MDTAELKEQILQGLSAIAPEARLDELSLDENIRQTLDIDSYDFLKFLVELNDRLGVDIPEADYGKLTTLQAMTEYLSARMQ